MAMKQLNFMAKTHKTNGFKNKEESISNRIIYITDELLGRLVATWTHRYKFVLLILDLSWLFDQNKNPDELISEYENINELKNTHIIIYYNDVYLRYDSFK